MFIQMKLRICTSSNLVSINMINMYLIFLKEILMKILMKTKRILKYIEFFLNSYNS